MGSIYNTDKKGHLHCDDGPAEVSHDGGRIVYARHGKLHRTDGPAIIFNRGNSIDCCWYVDNIKYTNYKDYSVASGMPLEDIMLAVLANGWTI